MKLIPAVTLALLPLLGGASKAQDGTPLKLTNTIPLPGLKDGDFDHFAPDVEGHRLFLTAEENGKVEVLDTNTNQVIHTIDDLKAPHAILYRKDLKKLFIVDGDLSAVEIYDSENYQKVEEIKVAVDADSIAYDPATSLMYVVTGGREAHTPYSIISVIDTNSAKKVRDIKINSNHVEAIVLEKSGPRMFCNITGQNTVEVVDRNKGTVLATWPLPARASGCPARTRPTNRAPAARATSPSRQLSPTKRTW